MNNHQARGVDLYGVLREIFYAYEYHLSISLSLWRLGLLMMEVQGLPSFVDLASRFKKRNISKLLDKWANLRRRRGIVGPVMTLQTRYTGRKSGTLAKIVSFLTDARGFSCISKTFLFSSYRKQTGDQLRLSVRDALAYYSCLGWVITVNTSICVSMKYWEESLTLKIQIYLSIIRWKKNEGQWWVLCKCALKRVISHLRSLARSNPTAPNWARPITWTASEFEDPEQNNCYVSQKNNHQSRKTNVLPDFQRSKKQKIKFPPPATHYGKN